MLRIGNPSAFCFGLFLAATAALGFWMTSSLRVGTATNMGPGYMPLALCWILLGLGAAITARGLLTKDDTSEPWKLRPVIFILVSIACFAVGIEPLGLAATIIVLVGVGAIADPESRWWETALLSVGLALFSSIVFVNGLGLPMELWPRGLR